MQVNRLTVAQAVNELLTGNSLDNPKLHAGKAALGYPKSDSIVGATHPVAVRACADNPNRPFNIAAMGKDKPSSISDFNGDAGQANKEIHQFIRKFVCIFYQGLFPPLNLIDFGARSAQASLAVLILVFTVWKRVSSSRQKADCLYSTRPTHFCGTEAL